MIVAARRRAGVYPLPDSPTTYHQPPTPDGSNDSTHASVIDLGRRWNGYRWWMANTPYPSVGGDIHENPCIYGSNDRVTWTVPEGLTNPIYPWSGIPGEYNSDTELAWDPNRERLVCYWREYKPARAGGITYKAASSGDGVTWAQHGVRFTYPDVSPAIVRDEAAGGWRLYSFPGALHVADDILGPWTPGPALTNAVTPAAPLGGRHGDVIYCGGLWIAMSAYLGGGPPLAASIDGLAWHVGGDPLLPVGYRPTLEVSTEAGFVDVWTSRSYTYYRLPLSAWSDLIP